MILLKNNNNNMINKQVTNISGNWNSCNDVKPKLLTVNYIRIVHI